MQLRSSTQSKQRHILATRHLWESYLDDYRDFILYLQAVLLWRRPVDAVCGFALIHFLLWHILGSSSFLGVLAVLAILVVVAAWFLDTVQVTIPWHQLIPKVQKGHLALSPRPLHAAISSPSLVGVTDSGDASSSSTRSHVPHSSLQVTAETEKHLNQLLSQPSGSTITWRERFSEFYSRMLTIYLSKLPHVRMRSYQDIVLRMVILRIEASQLLRAVQMSRKENPDKFTIRAVLLLAAVALLGNALGTFFVVYSLVYGALLVPPFWVYNIPGRTWRLLREAAPSMLRFAKSKYISYRASEIQPESAQKPTIPFQATAVATSHSTTPTASSVIQAGRNEPHSIFEPEHDILGPEVPKSDDHLTRSDRFVLTSSLPIESGQVFLQSDDEAISDPESASILSDDLEDDFPRVLLPGGRLKHELGTTSPLSTSPTEKKSSSSQFIGFLKRNLSGALKNRPGPPSAVSSPSADRGIGPTSRRVRKSPLAAVDSWAGSETGAEAKVDEMAGHRKIQNWPQTVDSPELLRPKRTTKRRRSGSIEPVLLASLTDSTLRESTAPQGAIPIPRVRNTPSSPTLSPRLPALEDSDSSTMRPKIPKIPLVLLRGSRDDSVIQTPRYRP